MPWSNSRPRSRRYDHAHQQQRAALLATLRATGTGTCAEPVCVKPNRTITAAMDLHLCHDPTGRTVIGLGHAACNRQEAAVRARAGQNVHRLDW